MRGVGGFVLLEHYKEFHKFSMTYQYNFESVLFSNFDTNKFNIYIDI